jgi:hypothetical protein
MRPAVKRRLVTLAAVLSLLSCAMPSELSARNEGPATTQKLDGSALDDLRERALRDLPEFVDYRATRFLARGFTDDKEPVDPAPEFLARFNDLKPVPKPASSTRRSGPNRDEHGRPLASWHYRDPETGRRARVYYAIVRERRADGDVVVRVGFTSGPLSGGGREAIYRLVDGVWMLHRVTSEYVS